MPFSSFGRGFGTLVFYLQHLVEKHVPLTLRGHSEGQKEALMYSRSLFEDVENIPKFQPKSVLRGSECTQAEACATWVAQRGLRRNVGQVFHLRPIFNRPARD
jgi:hypothetical protein